MQCPACPTETLVMTDRQGIEIDYCPKCRGVWLDRGELDKLIERSAAQVESAPPQRQAQPQQPPPASYQDRGYQDRTYVDQRGGHYKQGYPHKKRKGLLGELFDFD